MIDRIFCGLLAIAAAGHLYGTLRFTQFGSVLFVWSLSGVLAAALVAALNILRLSRTMDKTLASVALAASLGWVLVVILFGLAIGNILDPRVLFHGIAALGLSFFSFQTLRT